MWALILAQTDCAARVTLKICNPTLRTVPKKGGKIVFLRASEGGPAQSIWSTTVCEAEAYLAAAGWEDQIVVRYDARLDRGGTVEVWKVVHWQLEYT